MIFIVIMISITIIVIIIIIIAIIINSIKDDIWDMNELFHKLTNFGEQSLKPCWQKKRKEDFHFLLIQRNSPQHWIVKDGVFCISCFQVGLDIVQSCYIIPSLVSLLEKIEHNTFFCRATSLQFGSFLHDKYFTSMWMFLQIGPLGPWFKL